MHPGVVGDEDERMGYWWSYLVVALLILVSFDVYGEFVSFHTDLLFGESEEFTNPDIPKLHEAVSTDANDTSQIVEELTNTTKKYVACRLRLRLLNDTIDDDSIPKVEIVNVSRLAEILTPNSDIQNRDLEAHCSLIFFYSKYCKFSNAAAPSFSAIAKLYPDIKMAAVDSVQHNRINTQYGIVGVPSVILFHNGRAISKYNGSEYSVSAFSKFINFYTGMSEADVVIEREDLVKFIPQDADKEIDYILLLAWAFVITVQLIYFSKTRIWTAIVETVKNTWREAEDQHEHAN